MADETTGSLVIQKPSVSVVVGETGTRVAVITAPGMQGPQGQSGSQASISTDTGNAIKMGSDEGMFVKDLDDPISFAVLFANKVDPSL